MHNALITPGILEGKAGTGGIVSGTALVLGEDLPSEAAYHEHCDDPQAEIARFNQSKEKATKELSDLLVTAQRLGGSDVRNIIHTQLEILNDPELYADLQRTIVNGRMTAEHAIEHVFRHYIGRIEETGSAYMMERTADLRDLRDRIYRHLHMVTSRTALGGNILVANEITPTELLEYAPHILGAVTAKGGATSHVTIIAASMGIPIVAGVKDLTRHVATGDSILIDADRHVVYLKPTSKLIAKLKRRAIQSEVSLKPSVEDSRPASTLCGHPIVVRANVEFETELSHVSTYVPEGIGLVRTESMLMAIGTNSTIEAQMAYYRSMADASGEHGVTFRLLDIGGDKLTERDSGEANPHLGWRGARLLLDRPAILEAQLDAILELSGDYPGRIRLMLPMVSVLDEWLAFRRILLSRMDHLSRIGIPYDEEIKSGMMIEVPSAAISAGTLAQHADFLSLGTNDLTQYVLAVDRGNPLVSDLYDSLHPSVLQAIAWTAAAGSTAGIPVAVCGEMASNPVAAACLIGLGIRELSMSARSIPTIRRMIRNCSMSEFQDLSLEMQAAVTRDDREKVSDRWNAQLLARTDRPK